MAKEKERVIETRAGKMSIPPERALWFPRGVIGFESKKEFTLVQLREDSPFMILQCMTDPLLGLLVTDPYSFMAEYEVVIGDAERKVLKIEDHRQVAILVTVSIPSGQPERTTLNLSGPIVINSEAQIGMQIPQTDSKYPAHFIPGMTPPKNARAASPDKDESSANKNASPEDA